MTNRYPWSGSPMRFGKSTEEGTVGRDDRRRSSGGVARSDRSSSTGRLGQEETSRELRSKSTSRMKMEDLEKSEKVGRRPASQTGRLDLFGETSIPPASHFAADRPGRMTRSMSAARDLAGNRGGGDAGDKNQEGARRNITRDVRNHEKGRRDSVRGWGTSWQQLEENTSGRMRSISSGRIPLEGRRSVSSTRVGIGTRRVRRIR